MTRYTVVVTADDTLYESVTRLLAGSYWDAKQCSTIADLPHLPDDSRQAVLIIDEDVGSWTDEWVDAHSPLLSACPFVVLCSSADPKKIICATRA